MFVLLADEEIGDKRGWWKAAPLGSFHYVCKIVTKIKRGVFLFRSEHLFMFPVLSLDISVKPPRTSGECAIMRLEVRKEMFKKAFFFVLVAMMISLPSIVSAEPTYYPYLNGDRNYINCGAHMGIYYYVLRDSINIESCDEEECILSIDIADVEIESQRPPIVTHEEPIIRRVSTLYFLYDFNDKQMYVDATDYFNSDLYRDKWYPLKYGASFAKGGNFEEAGSIAYYIVFDESFYGNISRFEDIN